MKSFTVESFPWDAGTDSGTTYAAADMATNPVGLISKITSGVLLAPGADSVEAVANWECATTTTDDKNSPGDKIRGKKKSKKSKKSAKKDNANKQTHKRYKKGNLRH